MKYKKSFHFLLLVLSGILTGLTLVFPKLGFLEWIAIAPAIYVLFISAEATSAVSLWKYGFAFFFSYGLVIFHWFLKLYPLSFIDGMTASGAVFVTAAGWIGLSILQALSGGFVFLLFGLLCKGNLFKRYGFLKPLLVASLWIIFEWSQTLGFAGVPWGRLAIGQSEYIWQLQSASVFGSYFVSFLIVFVNAVVAYALIFPQKLRLCIVLCAAVILGNTALGACLYFIPNTSEGKLNIAAIQGNISTEEKWNDELIYRTFEVYREYTVRAADMGSQVILWPETALPFIIPQNDIATNYLKDVAIESDSIILASSFTKNEADEQYNSVYAVFPDGSFGDDVYSKRHLVPFGEYLPMGSFVKTFLPPLASLIRSDELTAGKSAEIIEVSGAKIGPLICFDSIYEELARDSVNSGAQLLTISTNDSWFSDSAALYMHNSQAQLRAIENGRYVVRAANTGVSSVISNKGEIILLTEPLKEDILMCKVELYSYKTPYSIIGNAFVYLCIAAVFLALLNKIYFRKSLDNKDIKC